MRGTLLLAIIVSLSIGSVASCSLAASEVGGHDQPLCSYPCLVRVQGTLVKQDRWGPPNFGQTPKEDARVAIYLIRLAQPVSIKLSRAPPGHVRVLYGIREIQLEKRSGENLDLLIGKRVSVSGKIIEGLAPMQFTQVVLILKTIELQKAQ